MKVEKFCIGSFGENTYVVYDESSNECFVVDPGLNINIVIDYISKNKLNVKYIFITHAHIDHIEGVAVLKRKLGGKVLVHSKDAKAIEDEKLTAAYVLSDQFEKFVIDGKADLEDDLKIENNHISIIHIPGHTQGSMAILVENLLFSGDTLFKESIGRTDFPGGDFKATIASIKEKLFKLDKDTVVYPGHGDRTTIENEMKHNYFVNGDYFEC